jgi:hypothetical protein
VLDDLDLSETAVSEVDLRAVLTHVA